MRSNQVKREREYERNCFASEDFISSQPWLAFSVFAFCENTYFLPLTSHFCLSTFDQYFFLSVEKSLLIFSFSWVVLIIYLFCSQMTDYLLWDTKMHKTLVAALKELALQPSVNCRRRISGNNYCSSYTCMRLMVTSSANLVRVSPETVSPLTKEQLTRHQPGLQLGH